MLEKKRVNPRISRFHTRVSTLVLGVVGALVLTGALSASAGCTVAADCLSGERRCTPSGAIEECVAHHSGVDVTRDSPSVSHHDGSPSTWELQAECGAGRCQTEPTKDSHNVPKQNAFCTLSTSPDAVCSDPAGGQCVGTSSVQCHHGFIIASKLCAVCETKPGACTGAIDGACEIARDCAEGLRCNDRGHCEMPCACAEGERCESCDVADRDTLGPTRPKPSSFVCKSGACFRSYL